MAKSIEKHRVNPTEFRKQWSHKPTPIPQNASGLWYSEECVDELLAAFASQVVEQSKWVSVAEKPKERHEVLICHNYYAERAVEPAFYSEGWWQLIRTDSEDMPIVIDPEQVTHWMEIPAPPQTTEQERK